MLIGVALAGACGSTAFVPPPPSPRRVYGASEVDERPEIVQTPPLHYPEGGRQGVVVVRVEFSAAPMPAIKMHIAGDVYSEADTEERPHLMSGPSLAYPAPMLLSRISGRVVIEAVIDTTGRVEDGTVRVLVSSDARFNEAAKDYVRAARFTPGRLAGTAVRVRFAMPVEFMPPTRN